MALSLYLPYRDFRHGRRGRGRKRVNLRCETCPQGPLHCLRQRLTFSLRIPLSSFFQQNFPMTRLLPNPVTHPQALIAHGKQNPAQMLAEGPALLTAARRAHDRHSESVILTALAGANLHLSQLDAARDLYAQALATAGGNLEGEARVLTHRLFLYIHADETSTLGDDTARLQATWPSLRTAREQIAALNTLAGVAHRQRQTEASRAWLTQGYELALQSGEAEAAGQVASNLSTSFTHSREYGVAIAWVHRALQQDPQQAETLRP